MKKLTAFVSSLLLVTATLCADTVVVQKVEGAGQSMEMTMKLKNGKARVDVNPQISTIIDGSTGDIVTLMHAQKSYMKMPAATTKALMERLKAAQAGSASATPAAGASKLQPTGKKETVNGYNTEIYTASIGDVKVTYWIAKDFPNFAKVLSEMMATQQSGPIAAMTKGLAPEPKDFPGMPIKTEIDNNGQKFTSTIVSVKEEAVADSEFDAPADYKEMSMPTFPTQPPQ